MKRLSGRLAPRRAIAVAGAGALLIAGLAAGLGAAGASAAERAATAAPATKATSVPMWPCAIKYAAGSLYVGGGDALPANVVYKISERTGDATSIATTSGPWQYPNGPCGVAVDGAGNLLAAVGSGFVVAAARTGTFYGLRMTAGHIYPIVLNIPGPAVDVQLDPSGNVVISVPGGPATHTNYETDSQIYVLAERSGAFYGHKMAKGGLYLIAGVRNGEQLSDPCDVVTGASARAAATPAISDNLGWSIGTLRFDAHGNIVIADGGSETAGGPCGGTFDIPGQVVVIPGRTGTYYGQRMTVGDIYPIAGLGTQTRNGERAIDSAFGLVTAVALDHAGNILVAGLVDGPGPAPDILYVIAARTGTFYGQKMVKGDIYAIPLLHDPTAVAVDNAGNVLIGDIYFGVIQMLAEKTGAYYGVKARAGHVYTIGGTGTPPYPDTARDGGLVR